MSDKDLPVAGDESADAPTTEQREQLIEAIAERVRYRNAARLAREDIERRFPVVTPENAREALAYQEQRIAHYLRTCEPEQTDGRI